MAGADIVTYLLEKTRVVTQSADERNYHIYYQVFSGMSADERAAFSLGAPESCAYLRNGLNSRAAHGALPTPCTLLTRCTADPAHRVWHRPGVGRCDQRW